MLMEGIHHVTAIIGDAPRNLDFYTRVVGLRLVAKTVNQEDPNVYHLFYGEEQGRPVADLTFFEYRPWDVRGEQRGGWIALDEPPAQPGRQSAGTVHHVAWGIGDDDEQA